MDLPHKTNRCTARMKLSLCFPDSYYSNVSVTIPDDDYNFHLVVVRGRQVSIQGEPSYVEMVDLCQDAEGRRIVFKMSILDASILSTEYPFIKTGLIGQYHLNANGFLKFIKEGPEGNEASSFLKDSASHEFMRSRYIEILDRNEL